MSKIRVQEIEHTASSNTNPAIALNANNNVTFDAGVTAASFTGNGANLTNVPAPSTYDAANLTGVLPAIDGSALTGTADATKLPLTGGTVTGPVTFQSAINETKHTFTDAATITIDPDNAMIQYVLFQNTTVPGGSLARTINVNFDPFQSCLFYFGTDGTSGYSITWDSNISWIGGNPPSIHSNGYQFIEFWSESTTKIFGAIVGEAV